MTDTTSIAGGGGSAYPVLRAKALGVAAPNNVMDTQNSYPGFSDDGDYVLVPATSTGNIEYYNSSKILQWSKSITDVNAAVDKWFGWRRSDDGALLHGLGIDEGTTPITFYTFTINSAGTIANIGNDQIASDFSPAVEWGDAVGVDTSSNIQINEATDIITLFSGNDEVATIDFTDGQFLTAPTTILTSGDKMSFKTTAGDYVHEFTRVTGEETSQIRTVNGSGSSIFSYRVPTTTGIPAAGVAGVKPIEWNNYIAMWSNATKQGAVFVEQSAFATFITNLRRSRGV